MSTRERLDLVRWHIVRIDGLRSAMWTRASGVVGADALVGAAAAVLLNGQNCLAWPYKLPAAATLLLLGLSTVFGAGVLGLMGSYQKVLKERDLLLLYSTPDTVTLAATAQAFREGVRALDWEAECDAAVTELWRLSRLYTRRLTVLNRALALLVASIVALAFAVLVSVLVHAPSQCA